MNQLATDKTNASLAADWAGMLQSAEYAKVERRILSQLIESLIYEKMVECEMTSEPGTAGDNTIAIKAVSETGVPLVYHCFGERKFSFARVRLNRDTAIVRVLPDGARSEARLVGFVSETLGPLVPEDKLRVFMEELGQTLLNDVQAHYALPRHGLSVAERGYDAMEANVIDGHPYHPCYKSRIGFSLRDNEMYGPEFTTCVKPVWLAVHVEESAEAYAVSLDSRLFWEKELGTATAARFASRIEAAGANPRQFRLLPVHPWQWRETIIRLFYRQLAEKRIIFLGEGADDYLPQQSIRTLANATAPGKAYLKLPMNIRNTSTGRILAKHTVLNAPLISDWLSGLARRDEYAAKLDFVLLREVAGMAYDHDILPNLLKSQAYGALSAIWRESLHPYLREGEEAVPFNALCHVDRAGRPFIEPWVRAEGVEAWTERLLQVSVEPLIHMLFAHGVALEAHAQNMILIHRQGVPTRVALKDFHDGVRFSRRHLENPQACPKLHALPEQHAKVNPNSFIETDKADEVRDFMHDALFFINLAELCFFLHERFGLPEERFWRMTARVVRDYQSRHPRHRERFEAFDLFAESIRVEQLTSRRLLGDTQVRLQAAPNPLYPFR